MEKMIAFVIAGVLLSVMTGCATEPLTAYEQEQKIIDEQLRVETFVLWREWCKTHGIMVVRNSWSCSSGRLRRDDCIPSRHEWKFTEREVKGKMHIRVISNTYSCQRR